MLKGFKQFLLRGNVIDLAVAVVIGGAFGAVVKALVDDLLPPLIAAIGGKPDFQALRFTVNGSAFKIGDFGSSRMKEEELRKKPQRRSGDWVRLCTHPRRRP